MSKAMALVTDWRWYTPSIAYRRIGDMLEVKSLERPVSQVIEVLLAFLQLTPDENRNGWGRISKECRFARVFPMEWASRHTISLGAPTSNRTETYNCQHCGAPRVVSSSCDYCGAGVIGGRRCV